MKRPSEARRLHDAPRTDARLLAELRHAIERRRRDTSSSAPSTASRCGSPAPSTPSRASCSTWSSCPTTSTRSCSSPAAARSSCTTRPRSRARPSSSSPTSTAGCRSVDAAERDVLRDFVLQSVWAMFAEDLAMLPVAPVHARARRAARRPCAVEPRRPGPALRVPERAARPAERGDLRGNAVRERLAVRAPRARAPRAGGAGAAATGVRVELAQGGAGDLRRAAARVRSAASGSGRSARTTRPRRTS